MPHRTDVLKKETKQLIIMNMLALYQYIRYIRQKCAMAGEKKW
jgi:hypothetical protein